MSEKEFQLDKKELLKDVPVLAKALVGGLIDWFNKVDANHDGHADIAQIAPLIIKALPVINALAPLINWEKLLTELIEKYSHDPSQAERLSAKLIDMVVEHNEKAPGSVA